MRQPGKGRQGKPVCLHINPMCRDVSHYMVYLHAAGSERGTGSLCLPAVVVAAGTVDRVARCGTDVFLQSVRGGRVFFPESVRCSLRSSKNVA